MFADRCLSWIICKSRSATCCVIFLIAYQSVSHIVGPLCNLTYGNSGGLKTSRFDNICIHHLLSQQTLFYPFGAKSKNQLSLRNNISYSLSRHWRQLFSAQAQPVGSLFTTSGQKKEKTPKECLQSGSPNKKTSPTPFFTFSFLLFTFISEFFFCPSVSETLDSTTAACPFKLTAVSLSG